jgi:hypothetical protein
MKKYAWHWTVPLGRVKVKDDLHLIQEEKEHPTRTRATSMPAETKEKTRKEKITDLQSHPLVV